MKATKAFKRYITEAKLDHIAWIRGTEIEKVQKVVGIRPGQRASQLGLLNKPAPRSYRYGQNGRCELTSGVCGLAERCGGWSWTRSQLPAPFIDRQTHTLALAQLVPYHASFAVETRQLIYTTHANMVRLPLRWWSILQMQTIQKIYSYKCKLTSKCFAIGRGAHWNFVDAPSYVQEGAMVSRGRNGNVFHVDIHSIGFSDSKQNSCSYTRVEKFLHSCQCTTRHQPDALYKYHLRPYF